MELFNEQMNVSVRDRNGSLGNIRAATISFAIEHDKMGNLQ